MRIIFAGLAGKKLLLSVFFLFLTGMVFGTPTKFTPPKFESNDPGININIEEINNAAIDAFIDLQNLIEDFLPDNFYNLARGFANASVFSSDGASQRGYGGYKAFSFTFGFVSAAQLPQFDILKDFMDSMNSDEGEIASDLFKKIAKIPFGLDLQILNAKFGINTSFLMKNLYLGFKFSKFDSNWMNIIPISGFSFKTMSMGVNASYQLITQKRLPTGLLLWRGLNIGSGFIWQNTNLSITPTLPEDMENVLIPIPVIGDEISIPVNGVIHLGFETNNYIVPIEAMTSIRLLFLNVALGAGVDIAFGSTTIDASGSLKVDKDKVNYELQPKGLTMVEAPSIDINLEGKSGPSSFNPKIMGAVGFNFGPIIIDIPLTYYFKDNGYSFGVTFGLTF
jgi:hypothetical protein